MSNEVQPIEAGTGEPEQAQPEQAQRVPGAALTLTGNRWPRVN